MQSWTLSDASDYSHTTSSRGGVWNSSPPSWRPLLTSPRSEMRSCSAGASRSVQVGRILPDGSGPSGDSLLPGTPLRHPSERGEPGRGDPIRLRALAFGSSPACLDALTQFDPRKPPVVDPRLSGGRWGSTTATNLIGPFGPTVPPSYRQRPLSSPKPDNNPRSRNQIMQPWLVT